MTQVPEQIDLLSCALRHGTDKATAHSYISFYEELLQPRRAEPLSLLEIGVGGGSNPKMGGESLRMWKEYLPLGQITGLDLYDKTAFEEPRIRIYTGDQTDPELLLRIALECGPFDVIIDDGSHRPPHVVASFTALFPHLRDGGIYVIEDLQTSYWPTWGGRFRASARHTSMSYLKARVDGLNWAELRLPNVMPGPFDQQILEIRFRHNIAAIVKGDNREPSNSIGPHPIPTSRWLRHHLIPALEARARGLAKPAVERLGLLSPARKARAALIRRRTNGS